LQEWLRRKKCRTASPVMLCCGRCTPPQIREPVLPDGTARPTRSTHHVMQLVEFSVDMLLPEQVRQTLSLESGLAYRPGGQRRQASRPGEPIQPALQGVHWDEPAGLAVRLPQNPHDVDAFAAVA